jgi:glycosyltransferase involved in cell wall biosynthesis
MKISYAITVCDELDEIKRLLSKVKEYKRPEDEICVLLDKPKASSFILDILHYYSSEGIINLRKSTFNGNFSEWKNELNNMCTGDYIFQIDADEVPTEKLIQQLPAIIEQNLDVVLVPRVNTVIDITYEHIMKWGWKKDENSRINWPDYQWRLYKNSPEIKWINKVHERLDGFKTYALLPAEEDYALIHVKTIERQEKQNELYHNIN